MGENGKLSQFDLCEAASVIPVVAEVSVLALDSVNEVFAGATIASDGLDIVGLRRANNLEEPPLRFLAKIFIEIRIIRITFVGK